MSNELVKIEKMDYALVEAGNIGEVIRENLGGSTISLGDLDKVKVPAGGGSMWDVPTLGGVEQVKELVGVVVYFHEARKYWKQRMSDAAEQTAPDCNSDDGLNGRGTPGGSCLACPMAKFDERVGTSPCKPSRVLYIARKDSILPMQLTVPVTSVSVFKKLFLQLATKGVKYYHAELKIGLERAKSQQNIQYSRITVSLSRMLTGDAAKQMDAYVKEIRPILEPKGA